MTLAILFVMLAILAPYFRRDLAAPGDHQRRARRVIWGFVISTLAAIPLMFVFREALSESSLWPSIERFCLELGANSHAARPTSDEERLLGGLFAFTAVNNMILLWAGFRLYDFLRSRR